MHLLLDFFVILVGLLLKITMLLDQLKLVSNHSKGVGKQKDKYRKPIANRNNEGGFSRDFTTTMQL